ncbi:PASTA domain-containing protein [Amycolatopsis sp. 195334CR]|uniref:PASTA domain-containing protein n=1 Tax=Amycolatopsis sp. 195334CR TaxID=2814588 RepID=UPI001A8F5102|nr:PASTA domain-containing protein [Amycolatopsis sp. 195334CR]MBN6041660.1 PASTA domain-containing protein [Amycolatopsis sp. 195334CR]
MTRTEASLVGTLLDRRYRVDRLLARGGMSSVYRGVDTRLDRPVAIKVMDPRFADDRSFVDRFEREARSAAKLHHQNVVAVHDQGLDTSAETGRAFLVMELVDGGTLREVLTEQGPLDIALALSVAEPVLSALAAAHRAGLVHRDVKPENVLIGRGGQQGAGVVKVGDFGLVRAVASAGTTSSSVILGTVAYLSPEQVTVGAASVRGDVYSAGILLYEMLTGQTPYTGDTAISVAYRHVNDDVPAPSQLRAGIPPALDQLVLRATRRDPEARPADAGAFLDELLRVRAELGIGPVPVPVPPPPDLDRESDVEKTTPHLAAIGAAPAAPAAPAVVPTMHPHPHPADQPTVQNVPQPGAHHPGQSGPQTVVQHPGQSGPQATVHHAAVSGPQTAVQSGPQTAVQAGPQAAARQAPVRHATKMYDRPPTPPTPPPPSPPAGTPAAAHEEPPPPRNRKRLYLVLGLVVLLIGGTIGAATWWYSGGRYAQIPKLAGMSQAEAGDALRAAQLNPAYTKELHNTVPAGTVIRTDPDAGTEVLLDEQVSVVVSEGQPVVPDIKPGADPATAEQSIRLVKLEPRLDPKLDDYSPTVPKGAVVKVDPTPGSKANIGDPVSIGLSKGPPPLPVPDVTGKSKEEAFKALTDAGFQPFEAGEEFVQNVPAGKVSKTSPPGGTTVTGGDKRVGVFISSAVQVPNVVGRSPKDAAKILREAGLDPEFKRGRDDEGNDFNLVLETDPPAGTPVGKGTKIKIRTFL